MIRPLRRPLRWTLPLSLAMLLSGCGDNSAYLPAPRPPSNDDEELMAQVAAAQAARAAQAAAKPGSPGAAPAKNTPGANASAGTPAAGGSAATTNAQPTNAAEASKAAGNSPPSGTPSPPAATMSELTRRERTIVKLRRIAQALESYRQNNGCYPPPSTGNKTVSWRVLLLPALGRGDLYQKFRLHEPWNSEHNQRLLSEIPEDFRSLERNDEQTTFLLVRGPRAAFEGADELTEDACPDGFENTMLVVEAANSRARPWTQPDDLVVAPETLRDDLFSQRQDCCFAIFGGAAGVRRIAADIPTDRLNALITRGGRETVRYQDATTYAHPEIDRALIEKLKNAPPTAIVAAAPGTPATEVPAADAGSPAAGAAATSPTIPAGAPTTATPANAPSASANSASAAAANDRRRSVPPDDRVDAASNLVRDLYGDEYAKAKTRDKRREFARKLLDESSKVGADDAGLYVLLRAARDIAAKAGDLTTALDAADRMSAEFVMDALAAKLTLLEQAMAVPDDDSQLDAVHDNGLKLGDEAVQADRFDEAQRLYRLAMSAVRRESKTDNRLGSRTATRRVSGIDERETTLQERESRLRDAKRAHARVSDRVHLLLREPNNPAANSAVGRYFCLIKEDWSRGLPMLARGDDQPLKDLADLDLANPSRAEDQADLADRWWTWSEQTNVDLERDAARRHARDWYERALPQLPASLLKVRVEKRVADVVSLSTGPDASRPRSGDE